MRRRLVPFVAMALLAVAATAAPAGAQGPQPRVVSETPVSWTPNVLDGTVYAIAVVGEQVVVGGDFHRVASPDGSRTYRRNGLFAFQLGTGTVSDGFAPAVTGPVLALATGPAGTVYAGGRFTTLGGASRNCIGAIDASSGAATSFNPGASLDVKGLSDTVARSRPAAL